MHFELQWPDGQRSRCYSPSLVIRDYFEPGADYALTDFLARARTSLGIASERVRAKYGFACSRAMDQLAEIEAAAEPWQADPAARVRMLSFDEGG